MARTVFFLTIAVCLLAATFAAPAENHQTKQVAPEKDDLEASASHWGGHYGGFGYGYGYYPHYGYWGWPSYGYGWYGHGWPYGYGHGYWW
ncbi:neuropeptide-like protein 29 [Zerene cesonia]|uniref:neuropeptide-like protein 29 n=1 Tax=Zerene cesonia TaxID=33412 RepID=UPI0018E50084|nr:neuropeptide-like protein 29 [Zerene cesonia]